MGSIWRDLTNCRRRFGLETVFLSWMCFDLQNRCSLDAHSCRLLTTGWLPAPSPVLVLKIYLGSLWNISYASSWTACSGQIRSSHRQAYVYAWLAFRTFALQRLTNGRRFKVRSFINIIRITMGSERSLKFCRI